jgi:hypothetical protein
MLSQLSHTSPYLTVQVLSSVCTPERLGQVCGITTEQLAQRCSALTMCMAFLLTMPEYKQPLMQGSGCCC